MMRRSHGPAGFTLLELMVVTVVIAVALTVTGIALREPVLTTKPVDSWPAELERGRARAVRGASPVVISSDSLLEVAHSVLFLPDGRAVGPDVDELTGRPRVGR